MKEYIYLERAIPKHIVKQIRADVLKPIAKLIDNYACGRELHVINAINNYIYEQTNYDNLEDIEND